MAHTAFESRNPKAAVTGRLFRSVVQKALYLIIHGTWLVFTPSSLNMIISVSAVVAAFAAQMFPAVL